MTEVVKMKTRGCDRRRNLRCVDDTIRSGVRVKCDEDKGVSVVVVIGD